MIKWLIIAGFIALFAVFAREAIRGDVPPTYEDPIDKQLQEGIGETKDIISVHEAGGQQDEQDKGIPSGATIDLSNQGLSKAPEYIFSRRDTEVLDLSHNNLDGALQAEIRHLAKLKVLDLSDNDFTGVPAEVGQLSKLEVFDLSNNQLTGLPYELGNLQNLRTLDLRGNNYAEADLAIILEGLPASTEIIR